MMMKRPGLIEGHVSGFGYTMRPAGLMKVCDSTLNN